MYLICESHFQCSLNLDMEYYFGPEGYLTWTEARSECVTWGGYLATVANQEQNDYFRSEIIKR